MDSPHDRVLPHDLDAERALLGSCMLEPDVFDEVSALVSGESFFYDIHRKLFCLMLRLRAEGQPIDGIVIKAACEKDGAFDELGVWEFLGGLVSAVPSSLRASHYAEIVRAKFLRRKLIGALHGETLRAYDANLETGELLSGAERAVCAVTEQRVGAPSGDWASQLDQVYAAIENHTNNPDGHAGGLTTGFPTLDERLAGLQPGELIMIAARTSIGKTSLALDFARHIAFESRLPCLFFSFEMAAAEMLTRILAREAQINLHAIRLGKLQPYELDALRKTAGALRDTPIYLERGLNDTIDDLRAKAAIMRRKQGIRAVFVDYLQQVASARRAGSNRYEAVGDISRGCKIMAGELGIPVVAMVQVNREGDVKDGPQLRHLRESGNLEQDADIVLFLWPDPPGQSERIKLRVAKNRNGPLTVSPHIELTFTGEYASFRETAPGAGPVFVPEDSQLQQEQETMWPSDYRG